MMTHIDVGYSRPIAHILGIQPTTLILCGAKDGKTIRDDRSEIQRTGTWPAACDCLACQTIAYLMWEQDIGPQQARRMYQRTIVEVET